MLAPHHPRQRERLQALQDLGILDTEREAEFDDVVKLASALCGTPISVVNLIDADRQWFKAEVGLGVRETPLETSICAHAILEDDFVEIADTLSDPRMAGNPLVHAAPGLRFYAGALLKDEAGLPYGTLCVLDYLPRRLSDTQREALRVLARLVTGQLELRRALARAEMLRREVDHRVKNSLQIILSLTAIEARRARTGEAREALALVRDRVMSVAELHDQLYNTSADGSLALDAYLAKVVAKLASQTPPGIKVLTDLAPVTVSSRQAASVGLLVNEYFTNAVKHAFVGRVDGTINLFLAQQADGLILMEFRDDGIGMPSPPPELRPGGGLGLQVTQAIASQLSAEISTQSGPSGTSVRLKFAAVSD